MTDAIGKSERATQRRVIEQFCEELGYRYLDNGADRDGKPNIEEKQLIDHLRDRGATLSPRSTR